MVLVNGAQSMDYKAFFEKAIDGYLLHDLANMSEVSQKPGESAGALGYSMLAITCSGMELLGAILRRHKYRKDTTGNSGNCFHYYFQRFLVQKNSQYRPYGNLFWQFVRNGIAHTYVLVPYISVTKQGQTFHLKAWERDGNDHFNIDCLQLYRDFRASYEDLVKSFLSKASDTELRQIQENIDALLAEEDVHKYIPEEVLKHKLSGYSVPTTPSGMHAELSAMIIPIHEQRIIRNAMIEATASIMTKEQAEQLKQSQKRDSRDRDEANFYPDLDQLMS